MRCGSCGRESDADARFRATCGAPLHAAAVGAEIRKVVTIVFTDVAGSIALGERLDAESLRRVMWSYFDAMQATLERHGGAVELHRRRSQRRRAPRAGGPTWPARSVARGLSRPPTGSSRRRSRTHGDRDEPTELRAEIERSRVTFMRGMSDAYADRRVARRAIAVFERLGSEADLADAWQLMGLAELEARDRGSQLVALQRGRVHAIASGDVRRQIEAWNEVGGAMIFGRTPVRDALEFVEAELVWARERGLPAVEADALLGGPYLDARLGRFGEARGHLERSKVICRELGIAYGLAEAHMAGSEMKNARGKRQRSRAGAPRRHLGRDDGRVAIHRPTLHRTRLAHVLAVLGRDADAVVLAREAADFMEGNEDITAYAEILVDLAEVLRAHGDMPGAADALAEALALHEEKGNVVVAEHCRRLLRDLPAGGPATTTR